jgi:sulfite reductase beta subunit-like hemoprotein
LVTKKAVALPDELLALAAHPQVTCCPGAAWCSRGLTDCRAAAEAIAEKLKGKIPGDLSVRISGCPNNCPMPSVADIGLIGRVRSIDGARRECYKLVAAGGGGKTDELAIPLASAVTAEQVPQVVEWLLEQYGNSKNGLSFGQFIRLKQGHLRKTICEQIPSLREHSRSRK